jgi:hypothetical protein
MNKMYYLTSLFFKGYSSEKLLAYLKRTICVGRDTIILNAPITYLYFKKKGVKVENFNYC